MMVADIGVNHCNERVFNSIKASFFLKYTQDAYLEHDVASIKLEHFLYWSLRMSNQNYVVDMHR